MREIKFRSWDNFNAVMTYSKNSIQGLETFFLQYNLCIDGGNKMFLMQYTGLKDKNGKDIYEGDILNIKTTYKNNMADLRFQGNTLVEIIFLNGSFVDKYTHTMIYKRILSIVSKKIEYEVIGNIHENPELLEVVNE